MEFKTRASTNCSVEEAERSIKKDFVGYSFAHCELCIPLLAVLIWEFTIHSTGRHMGGW